MNKNALMRTSVSRLQTVNNVNRALGFAYNWENNVLGFGNSRAKAITRQQWNNHKRYKNMLARRLWALQAAQRNRPRRPERAARVIQRKFKKVFYAPNNNGTGLHGRGYRMTMARVRGTNASQAGSRERITGVLRAKLVKLRHANNTGNRGNMMNIYNSMGRNWEGAGGIHGANVMNNAQKIMFRAGLI
jgi:hypothetical protein